MVATLFAAVLAAVQTNPPAEDKGVPPLFAQLPPGPHGVAHLEELLRDAARPVQGAPRPVLLTRWVPSHAIGSAMRLRDYVALSAREQVGPAATDAQLRAAVDEHAAFLERAAHLDAAEARALLDQRLLARSFRKPLGPRFPLVLVAQGNGQSQADQAVLCEWLASHGYVVASTPSPMRITGPMKSEAEIAARAEEQAADLALALARLREDPEVDAGRVAVIGHSFGARAALLFAMSEPAVRALVSLDGGIGAKAGQAQLSSSRLFDPERARLPILHLFEEQDDFMAPDFALLRTLRRSHRLLARASHLRHIHFTSVGQQVALSPKLAAATKADAQTPRAAAAVLQAARRFLDAALSAHEPGALRASLRDLPDLALAQELLPQEP